jgi:hypothetical protein
MDLNVMAKKRVTTSTVAPFSQGVRPNSQSLLYCRTNGFLLGCFQALIRYRFARPDFAIHRSRILEFFEEAGIAIPLPADPAAYDRQGDELMRRVIMAARQRGSELGDFALLGTTCAIDAALRQTSANPSDELRDGAVGIMNKRGLEGAALYERFLVDVRRATNNIPGKRVSINSVLSPALGLLTATIKPLRRDSRMCFVAMPFAPPFSSYYTLLYQPIAAKMMCSSFRMWGGLSGEEYVDLMIAVIRRCGIFMADLTTLNPNVIYEVGVARGLEKKVILLCQGRDVRRVPANIGSDELLLSYSPRERGWPLEVILRVAAQVALMDFAGEITEDESAGARRTPYQALPELGVSRAEELLNRGKKTTTLPTNGAQKRTRPETGRH